MVSNRVVPFFLQKVPFIEPTNRCNMRCTYCYSASRDVVRGAMSLADFRTIVRHMRHFQPFKALQVDRVLFQGFGEPFLNPHIYDMIDILHNLGMKPCFNTNGKWDIPPDRVESLLKTEIIIASVDAVRNDVYRLGKPGEDVEAILRKFQELLRLRQAAGLDHPRIAFRMNLFRFNHAHLREYVTRCRELGIDRVLLVHGRGELMKTIRRIDHAAYAGFEDLVEYFPPPPDAAPDAGPGPGYAPDPDAGGALSRLSRALRRSGRRRRAGGPDEAFEPLPDHRIFYFLNCNGMTVRWNGQLNLCTGGPEWAVSPGNLLTTDIMDLLSADSLDRLVEMMVLGRAERLGKGGQKIVCDNCIRFKTYMRGDRRDPKPWNYPTMLDRV